MIRVVLDTNVLVAAVISPTGPNAQVFEQIVADKLRPYVTNAVIEEYGRVFEYERLRYLDKRSVTNVRRLLSSGSSDKSCVSNKPFSELPPVQCTAPRRSGLLKAAAIKVKSRGRLKLSEHEEDNRIYECALAAKAHYIVTENTKHFPKPHAYTKITTARQLIKRMEAQA
jgi:putative PIN family toxin of toxin-antitoxin system